MNSGSFGIVGLYLSTSVSNTAAGNGDGTEVILSFLFISCFSPAASFSISPLFHYPIVAAYPSVQRT